MFFPENGTVYTFGDGGTGQLGHGTTVLTAEIPLAIAWPRMVKVKSVSCGENHTAIVTGTGLLVTERSRNAETPKQV